MAFGITGGFYSLFVKITKVALVFGAIAIIGVLIVRLSKDPNEGTLTVERVETTPGQIELVKARYEGVDATGRPYTVSAEKASRSTTDGDIVILQQPIADLTLKNGTWLAVTAQEGTYNRTSAQLNLEGDVTLFHDAGYELKTKTLDIDIKSGQAVSKTTTNLQGPLGSIAANGMTVYNAGERVVFAGPATMVIRSLTQTEDIQTP